MSESDQAFLGTGWTFPPAFDWATREVGLVSDAEDIRESLWILLSTAPGERVMHPSYGCGLGAMVFETINEQTTTEICDLIDRAILFFEPRVLLDAVEVDTDGFFDGVLLISISYTIRSTNTRDNLVYPFYVGQRSLAVPAAGA